MSRYGRLTAARRRALATMARRGPDGIATTAYLANDEHGIVSFAARDWLLEHGLVRPVTDSTLPAGCIKPTLLGLEFAREVGLPVRWVSLSHEAPPAICRVWTCERSADPRTGYCHMHRKLA